MQQWLAARVNSVGVGSRDPVVPEDDHHLVEDGVGEVEEDKHRYVARQ